MFLLFFYARAFWLPALCRTR